MTRPTTRTSSSTTPQLQRPRRWWSLAWFSLCAAVCGAVGFQRFGFDREIQLLAIPSLAVSGAVAGLVLAVPLRWAACGRRWIVAGLLGGLAALIALELSLVLTLFVLGYSIAIPAGLFLAPLFGFFAWAVGGPLSGLGWILLVDLAASRSDCRRGT